MAGKMLRQHGARTDALCNRERLFSQRPVLDKAALGDLAMTQDRGGILCDLDQLGGDDRIQPHEILQQADGFVGFHGSYRGTGPFAPFEINGSEYLCTITP